MVVNEAKTLKRKSWLDSRKKDVRDAVAAATEADPTYSMKHAARDLTRSTVKGRVKEKDL